jgi:hypothetical protein
MHTYTVYIHTYIPPTHACIRYVYVFEAMLNQYTYIHNNYLLSRYPLGTPEVLHPELHNFVDDKSKARPVQAWTGHEGSRKLRLPDIQTIGHEGGKVVSLMHRAP